ncbi:NADP-dependent oxidoreductase [Dermacoccus nishinomiyaensis]|uniref:NADP-dependent oxidoreductase n=1 Tax=Dermacoccus TaxID=57495 RepID=UPI0010ABC8E2|nr:MULTISPECIES: NADP-dependent oxidoreductase [Dermacoccus]TJZ98069.1 NADP-dependent oxidoreductase [Dermacoccus nishinomiyaensis]
MKAMTYSRYGDDSVLELRDLDTPRVGPGEVLVRVKAASVNPVDWKVMSGGLDPLMMTVFPAVPGWDVAGVVEAVGLDAPEFRVGDEIMAYARKDVVAGGTFAELVTVPVRTATRKPASMTFEEAASLPLAGLTAYQTLTRLNLNANDTLLVHGAAGGVGSYAVQIAKHIGARVIGTASERNHEYVRGLGADDVVEYGDGLVERVRAIAPDGVTVSADYVGDVEEQTMQLLTPAGRHVSVADPSVALNGGLYAWVRPSAEDLAKLAQLVDDGALRVDIAATFPLERLADAFAQSREGHTRGKIVVTP